MSIGRELHIARLEHDLSQRDAGRAIGVSHSTWGRIERGASPNVSVVTLARALSVTGLDLSLRAFPGGAPMRDAAHLRLLARLHGRLGPGAGWATEVPLPIAGDRRAWDALISIGDVRIGVDAETRVRDLQSLERRLALKHRDGGADHVVLVLADTRHHRALMSTHAQRLAAAFPVPGRACLKSLAVPRDPGGSAIVLL